MIRVEDVWHAYSVKPVLRGINLHVKPGELVTVMGPNGMGKSTLLALIGGLMKPTRGQIVINGKVRRNSIEEEKAIRQQVFYLPAESFLPGMLTGREYVLGVARLWGKDLLDTMEHMECLLEIFDLKSKGDAAISSYSTGQKKKISICGALIAEAPVMVFDEPLSGGLDSSALMAVGQILKRLARRQDRSVIIAVPTPELAEEVSSKIAIIRDGNLQAYGTVDELRIQSGCRGSLAEVLEHLNKPETLVHIRNYLENRLA